MERCDARAAPWEVAGVFTSRDAARLLTKAEEPGALVALASALGFDAAFRLDRRAAREIGGALDARDVRVATGRGSLRALLLSFDAGADARAHTLAAARLVARGSPELRWLIIASGGNAPRVLVVAPASGGAGSIPLLEVATAAPHTSDLETFAALVGASEGTDLEVHRRWRETLGRDALSHRFYRELAEHVDRLATTAVGRADPATRRTIALLHTSRLLFLAFLESRGWLARDPEFLRRRFVATASTASHGRGQGRFLEPLFFGTLNTPIRARARAARAFGDVPFLNGGLFTRTPVERRSRDLLFSDDAIGEVIGGLLSRYRLTPRESAEGWSDAAVDPEMLGRAFESLMHAEHREARGAFYTPPALITRLARDGLFTVLVPRGVQEATLAAAFGGDAPDPQDAVTLDAELRALRVIDPACGSGAFLVHLLERIADLRRVCGNAQSIAELRREALARSIFGVDVDPTAVWLCQLRLWLSVVVEEPHEDPLQLAPLPNLDRNIREGDALRGDAFGSGERSHGSALTALRLRYTRAVGARKRTLLKVLGRAERQIALSRAEAERIRATAARRELLIAARSGDLFHTRRGLAPAETERLDQLRAAVRRARTLARALRDGAALPFEFTTHFPEAAHHGGFDLVIGNPPWVRPHAVPAEQRAELRGRFISLRDAAWRAGAEAAAAGRGFAAQADLAALFTERSVHLARAGGAVALVLPAKLWLALAGGGIRRFLAEFAPPLHLEDLSAGSAGFGAVVYPSLLLARRAERGAAAPTELLGSTHRSGAALSWHLRRDRLALDRTPGAPWLVLPGEVRDAFDRLAQAGTPLAASRLGRPLLGVKSGCNDAFLISRGAAEGRGLSGAMIRPVLRGEDLGQWNGRRGANNACILWTHGADGLPLAELPAAARRHLAPWRRQLERRSDARGARWWALFRTEAARHDWARVVWGDIGRTPRAIVLEPGDRTVPLNTCYVVRTAVVEDAYALAALLNSPVAAAWLSVLAEPARGGYRRFLGWTCARFPIPAAWETARAPLAEIGRARARGVAIDAWTLTTTALAAYGVRHADVAALLSWHSL
jgi:methylase of polypeptide subunit release factors